jgi:hypothetical protein
MEAEQHGYPQENITDTLKPSLKPSNVKSTDPVRERVDMLPCL